MSDRQKILLLTGASRGIGHATVIKFNACGWRVLTISRDPFDPRCPWEGGMANHIQLDLADLGKVQAAIPVILQKTDGHLDALINNAGISPKLAGGSKPSTFDLNYAEWLHVFNVNFFAGLVLAQGFRAALVASKGSIVNIGSIAGSRVHPFASAAYATSKAALSALTRELASDLGPTGVRVNAVAPGEIETSILSAGTAELVEREVPMRRMGKAKEVGDLLYFLCSPDATYITGSEIQINGGQMV
jgi:NAD(P)-dependent dehydrogenase (short-subunit alcohol dehydrogenase family)